MGIGSIGISKYVAMVYEALKKEEYNIELTPMATIIYGDDLQKILDAVRLAHDVLRESGIKRIVIQLNIDARHDKPERKPEDKVASVMTKISK